LHQLYQRCGLGQRQPGRKELMVMFSLLLTNTHRTFVIIDALDECVAGKTRDDLLDAIKEMIGIQSKYLNILVTSRKEKDIEDELQTVMDAIIDLKKGGGVENDIGLYVRKCLESDKKLRKWPPEIKQLVQNALEEGAQGM
jgi:hypothetical protein